MHFNHAGVDRPNIIGENLAMVSASNYGCSVLNKLLLLSTPKDWNMTIPMNKLTQRQVKNTLTMNMNLSWIVICLVCTNTKVH